MPNTASKWILGAEISWTRGRSLDDSLSGLITESECLDSLTPLPLDVFHVFWELYYPSHHRLRPAAKSTSCKHFAADKSRELVEVPIGTTVVWRDFADQQERTQRCRTEVYDYKPPCWRVRHSDGDWQELTGTEVEQGSDTPSASTRITSEVSKAKGRTQSSNNNL